MNAPVSVEAALRAKLGVPADAARVLVFGESSHWDTNWLQTSEGYYRSRLEPILAAVLRELQKDPLRVYCIESVFFLKLYWERHPEHHHTLRELISSRRLRLLSSSFTTPDTLLPHVETVLRDFHLGQRWLDAQGLAAAPTTAYFPDNFGHSPHTPSLMQELGVTGVGLTRIDGMYFIASDYSRKSSFPRPGSSAALLQQQHRSLDFVWRDDTGAEVLCHWNAFTYFQGDMLAHAGIIRWMGKVFGRSWRSERHVAGRIHRYLKELGPLARTPYLFCPIGMDFNDPIVDLRALLERYNRVRYPHTGTWVTLAGLDDYFLLLDCQRSRLPVLAVDPNPYWMGFYATRPEMKQRATRIARTLLLAETLACVGPPTGQASAALREGWNHLVLSNHHDSITGTSPDAIWHAEQRPWLDAAQAAATGALALTAQLHCPVAPPTERVRHAVAPPRPVLVLERAGGELRVRGPHYAFTLSPARGGCLTSLTLEGLEVLRGPGLDLVVFHDEGGLWRLGHEYAGGRFSPIARASARAATVETREEGGVLTVVVTTTLRGARFTRTLVCDPAQPFLRVSVEGAAPRRSTVTCRLETSLEPESLEMDTLGGTISRPRERLHSPTFWPVPSRLTCAHGGRTLHALFDTPTAASMGPSGDLEWIVARNATKERAFRLLPVLAHPIGGTNDEAQTHSAALLGSRGGGAAGALRSARAALEEAWLPASHQAARRFADALVQCDAQDVRVLAFKPAEDGAGLILRLLAHAPSSAPARLTLPRHQVHRAWRCDGRERDLWPLHVDARGRVTVELAGRFATVRLHTA